ncbi:MAG: replication initiator protein [Arizlama microvirus]|nr:MAG: replication initiator protein [Arizlama microvirus]
MFFGLSLQETPIIEKAWGMGHVQVDPLTPAAVNYVAGYVAKKIGQYDYPRKERVDKETGEVYMYQPPFLQMSRKPGIGGDARKYPASWRDTAVIDGVKLPVPRYLHEAWKESVDDNELARLEEERSRIPRMEFKVREYREAVASTKLDHINSKRAI